MNRNLSLLTALGAGLALAPLAVAQASTDPAPQAASAAQAPATPAPAPVAPQAVAAKIALINFEQVVLASNEGQVVTAKTQKKFEPQKNDIEKLAAEVDKLKKALAAAPATLPDADRASQLRAIDVKEKKLNSDAEAATTEYNNEWQEGLRGVAEKLAGTMKKYASDNGFTLLLDVSSQSSNVLWALPQTDISQAVVDLYNKTSGVAAPPPSAPRPAAQRPATRPTAPSASKPPAK